METTQNPQDDSQKKPKSQDNQEKQQGQPKEKKKLNLKSKQFIANCNDSQVQPQQQQTSQMPQQVELKSAQNPILSNQYNPESQKNVEQQTVAQSNQDIGKIMAPRELKLENKKTKLKSLQRKLNMDFVSEDQKQQMEEGLKEFLNKQPLKVILNLKDNTLDFQKVNSILNEGDLVTSYNILERSLSQEKIKELKNIQNKFGKLSDAKEVLIIQLKQQPMARRNEPLGKNVSQPPQNNQDEQQEDSNFHRKIESNELITKKLEIQKSISDGKTNAQQLSELQIQMNDIRYILNKITDSNLSQLKVELFQLTSQNDELKKLLIESIVERSVSEVKYYPVYVKLCIYINEQYQKSEDKQNTFFSQFCIYIQKIFQQEIPIIKWNENWKTKYQDQKEYSDMYYDERKKRFNTFFKFVIELQKQKFLSRKLISTIFRSMFSKFFSLILQSKVKQQVEYSEQNIPISFEEYLEFIIQMCKLYNVDDKINKKSSKDEEKKNNEEQLKSAISAVDQFLNNNTQQSLDQIKLNDIKMEKSDVLAILKAIQKCNDQAIINLRLKLLIQNLSSKQEEEGKQQESQPLYVPKESKEKIQEKELLGKFSNIFKQDSEEQVIKDLKYMFEQQGYKEEELIRVCIKSLYDGSEEETIKRTNLFMRLSEDFVKGALAQAYKNILKKELINSCDFNFMIQTLVNILIFSISKKLINFDDVNITLDQKKQEEMEYQDYLLDYYKSCEKQMKEKIEAENNEDLSAYLKQLKEKLNSQQ